MLCPTDFRFVFLFSLRNFRKKEIRWKLWKTRWFFKKFFFLDLAWFSLEGWVTSEVIVTPIAKNPPQKQLGDKAIMLVFLNFVFPKLACLICLKWELWSLYSLDFHGDTLLWTLSRNLLKWNMFFIKITLCSWRVCLLYRQFDNFRSYVFICCGFQPFSLWHQHLHSPYCSLYISDGIDKETLVENQELFKFAIISWIIVSSCEPQLNLESLF